MKNGNPLNESFLAILDECLPLGNRTRVLLAVSGGVDSVVMTELFMRAGLECAIAHCNFQLRGDESEEDEYFVRNLASLHGIPFFVKHFETREYADRNRLSIQMAARELRYAWFEQLRQEQHYDLVALAHNRSDQVETLLLNLSRGTGIRGLTGMETLQDKLFRPLLFAGRAEINQFARENSLSYREDSSNSETYYTRNRIRHRIINEFTEMNPRFEESMLEGIKKFRDYEALILAYMDQIRQELLILREGFTEIALDRLARYPATRTILYEILKEFRFSSSQCDEIAASLDGPPGKQYLSQDHRLIRDRDRLIITSRKEEEDRIYYIDEGTREITEPVRLSFRLLEKGPDFEIPSDPGTACIDFSMVSFPMMLRRWRKGDYFFPFGMTGMKKVSDFFIDRKYSLLEKEQAWILAVGDQIVWIVGDRIDNRFRITSGTREVLEITWKPDREHEES